MDLGEKIETLDPDMYCTDDVKYACAPDYVGKSNCEIMEYEEDLASPYQYFGGFGAGEDQNSAAGGVLGYADFCPMFYHYSNGDCRISESSHIYESFGADICPSCKCNEMYSSDFTKNYAICYETECVQNYLYSDQVKQTEYDHLEGEFYDNYANYNALRIKISNDGYSKHEYITCWSFESDTFKDTDYYSYKVKCPVFQDICYPKNPWICNGHGMINEQSTSIEDQCFCGHGYIGCDCTIRNTQENQENVGLIAGTCVSVEDVPYGESKDTGDINWDYLGLVNVTIQTDDRYELNNIAKTLRLWIAIDVKISEDNVWIDAIEELPESNNIISRSTSFRGNTHNNNNDGIPKTNYSISLAYYDDINGNKIVPIELIDEFHYLFNMDISKGKQETNGNQFVLYDIYNIKEPTSSVNIIYPSILIMTITIISSMFFM